MKDTDIDAPSMLLPIEKKIKKIKGLPSGLCFGASESRAKYRKNRYVQSMRRLQTMTHSTPAFMDRYILLELVGRIPKNGGKKWWVT